MLRRTVSTFACTVSTKFVCMTISLILNKSTYVLITIFQVQVQTNTDLCCVNIVYNCEILLKSMNCRGFHFKSIGVNTHAHKQEPPPNPRISLTHTRLFMNTVQIHLKSWDSRIPRLQLDLKIVHEFQLWKLKSHLFATSCLSKGHRVQQGLYRVRFLLNDITKI
jgi:hypothetical protein